MISCFQNLPWSKFKNRGISQTEVEFALSRPLQLLDFEDKKIYHALDDSVKFLQHIFMNNRKTPNVVITVYKTSKIKKYYKGEI